MEVAGVKDSTAARKLTAVSSFYGWCVDYDTSATPGLARDQAVALLAVADADAGPQAARTAALGLCAPLYRGTGVGAARR